MITKTPLTVDLVASLDSFTCPACGKHKRRGKTFCGGCYRTLPGPMAKALYTNGVTPSYAKAVAAAIDYIFVSRQHGSIAQQKLQQSIEPHR